MGGAERGSAKSAGLLGACKNKERKNREDS